MHRRYKKPSGSDKLVRNILGQLNWLQVEQRFSVDTNSPDVLLGSQKIKKTVLSSSVAELYFFYEMFWFMPVSSWIMDGHIWLSYECSYERTEAKNVETTARTIHLPEQKETNSHDIHVAKGSLFREYS